MLRHFLFSALAWRHTSSNSVTRNYCCRAREVTLSFMDTLMLLLTYLLTYLLIYLLTYLLTALCMLSSTVEIGSFSTIVWSYFWWAPGHGDCPVASFRLAVGPATKKARQPKMLSRSRGTVRWCRVTDCKRRRQGMSETGVQQSTRYSGALYCRQRCTVTPSLYWSGVQLSRLWDVNSLQTLC